MGFDTPCSTDCNPAPPPPPPHHVKISQQFFRNHLVGAKMQFYVCQTVLSLAFFIDSTTETGLFLQQAAKTYNLKFVLY